MADLSTAYGGTIGSGEAQVLKPYESKNTDRALRLAQLKQRQQQAEATAKEKDDPYKYGLKLDAVKSSNELLSMIGEYGMEVDYNNAKRLAGPNGFFDAVNRDEIISKHNARNSKIESLGAVLKGLTDIANDNSKNISPFSKHQALKMIESISGEIKGRISKNRQGKTFEDIDGFELINNLSLANTKNDTSDGFDATTFVTKSFMNTMPNQKIINQAIASDAHLKGALFKTSTKRVNEDGTYTFEIDEKVDKKALEERLGHIFDVSREDITKLYILNKNKDRNEGLKELYEFNTNEFYNKASVNQEAYNWFVKDHGKDIFAKDKTTVTSNNAEGKVPGSGDSGVAGMFDGNQRAYGVTIKSVNKDGKEVLTKSSETSILGGKVKEVRVYKSPETLNAGVGDMYYADGNKVAQTEAHRVKSAAVKEYRSISGNESIINPKTGTAEIKLKKGFQFTGNKGGTSGEGDSSFVLTPNNPINEFQEKYLTYLSEKGDSEERAFAKSILDRLKMEDYTIYVTESNTGRTSTSASSGGASKSESSDASVAKYIFRKGNHLSGKTSYEEPGSKTKKLDQKIDPNKEDWRDRA